jgi:hypothetical protein
MTLGIYPLAARSDLADVALRCMCTLLTEATHFNFRVNLMTCIVTRLSKKSWDQVCHRLYLFSICTSTQIHNSHQSCASKLCPVFFGPILQAWRHWKLSGF